MDQPELDEHLSRITTQWTVVFQAHKGTGETVQDAQAKLLQRYCGAIYRYLLATLRDGHAADELAQEFALSFVQGGFKGADPGRGRFRDYVKTSLFNLVRRYHRRKNKQPLGLDLEVMEPAAPEEASQADEQFITGWRDELLARTWEALAQAERESGQLFHTFLSYRTRNTNTSSEQMAKDLGKELGKPLTAAGVRQTIHRAREKFADLLLEEVGRSLETTDLDCIEQELIDLGLFSYCEEAIKKRR